MPHYKKPTGNKAHGLIVAALQDTADPILALGAVRALPREQVMEITTASYLKSDDPASPPVANGDVIAAFANSHTGAPIQDSQAHSDMDKFVQAIRRMPYFTNDIKHW